MLSSVTLKSLLHYNPDSGIFTRVVDQGPCRAGEVAGGMQNRGYLRIAVSGERHLAHRLAWLYMTGEWPPVHVDHKNGVRTDNRWDNLRSADRSQNQWNRPAQSDNSCGYKNICKSKKSWRIRIEHKGKAKEVYGFETPEDAHEFACLMREMMHGEFACHERSAA